MRFLADLIGGDEITDDAASAAAKMNLNLFGDDDSDAAGAGGDAQSQVRPFVAAPTSGSGGFQTISPPHRPPAADPVLSERALVYLLQMITIDVGESATSHVAGLMGELSVGSGEGGGGAGDDLLDLLDGAE